MPHQTFKKTMDVDVELFSSNGSLYQTVIHIMLINRSVFVNNASSENIK